MTHNILFYIRWVFPCYDYLYESVENGLIVDRRQVFQGVFRRSMRTGR